MKQQIDVMRKTISKDLGKNGTVISVFLFIACFMSIIAIILGLNVMFMVKEKERMIEEYRAGGGKVPLKEKPEGENKGPQIVNPQGGNQGQEEQPIINPEGEQKIEEEEKHEDKEIKPNQIPKEKVSVIIEGNKFEIEIPKEKAKEIKELQNKINSIVQPYKIKKEEEINKTENKKLEKAKKQNNILEKFVIFIIGLSLVIFLMSLAD